MKRSDRRDSSDEKIQKQIIRDCCKEIVKKYPIVSLDLGYFDSISKGQGKDGKYFSKDGVLTTVKIKRNRCKDSKAIDGVAFFRNKDTDDCLEIYFFCKFTKEHGGDQDYIPFEVEITRGCIEKNKNEKLVVVFMLEGGYWDSSVIEDCNFDGKKTLYANRNNIEEILTNILKIHKLI